MATMTDIITSNSLSKNQEVCCPSMPESLTANVVSRCSGTADELLERINCLREKLSDVLTSDYPEDCPKTEYERQQLPPLADRLDRLDDKLRLCNRILQNIQERLAV